VADELSDTVAELENLNAPSAKSARAAAEAEVVAGINALAEKIERIAAGSRAPKLILELLAG